MNIPDPIRPPPAQDPTLTSIATHVGAVVAGLAVAVLVHNYGIDSVTANLVGQNLGDAVSMGFGVLVTTGMHWLQAWLAARAAGRR